MSIISGGMSSFFGLDIGTTAVRLVQLQGNGNPKALIKYAYIPVDYKLVSSDAGTDKQKLKQVISELLTQANMVTKNVAVGISSQKVFTTVVDLDRLPKNELSNSIQYQADSIIPTPLESSKIDWAVLGDSPKDKNKLEVLLTSVSNDVIEDRLDLLESIGLNVIAFEPDSFALTRAVASTANTQPQMILDMGYKSSDLIVCVAGSPRLIRNIPTGSDSLIKSASQNLNIKPDQAQGFVFKFGLSQDKLEGQVYKAIINTVDLLISEIEKSIKFIQSRYAEIKIDRIIVTGGASALPEFPLYIANKFGINVEIGNAWQNVSFSPDRQNELIAVSHQFAVAAGLAERTM